jgi:colanic acid biosynthesis glycosyl transferase WcaI
MRILYVSQYFPPEIGAPAARVYELSRHWVAAGHRVTVLTGFPNHPTGVMPPEYRRWWRRGTMREVVQGIEVVRTWLYPAPNRRPWERIVNYTSFFVSAALRGLALPRTDVVIATSPQLLVGLAGWWLARARRCPFVFEVRDLWPESLVASGIGSEKALWIRALGRLARFLYERADLVVTVTEAMRQELVLRYGVPGNRVWVVENGVEIELFAPRADRDAVRRELGLEGRFVAAYIGTIGYAHGLKTVLEAAEALLARGERNVLFLLVGEGAEKERLERLAAERGVENVRFLGQQPRSAVPALIGAADACLVLLRRAAVFRTVLPSKLLEFMACGRPVVLAVEGYARSLVEEAGAGVSIEPESPQQLAEAVTRLARDPELCRRLGEAGRSFVTSHFARAAMAERYCGLLQALRKRRPGQEICVDSE